MRTCILLILLSAGILAQTAPSRAMLVYNLKVRTQLLQDTTKECSKTGFEGAIKEIEDHGFLVYAIDARKILKEDADKYSDLPSVKDALTEAVANKDKVALKTGNDDEWVSGHIKNRQIRVYAILNQDDTLDYYRIEFHLNMQDRQTQTKENYIGAMKYLACSYIKEWVQEYFKVDA